ncbi:MAG: hypothetical protein V1775_15480 [Bacteroidota bacterium]
MIKEIKLTTGYWVSHVFLLLLIISGAKASYGQTGKKNDNPSVNEIITTNPEGMGISLTIDFQKGPAHNHPLMAIWIEDTEGRYLQTLYVSRSVARGVFDYGDHSTGKWKPGEILRPAALPYWSHKRNVLNDKGNYMPRPGFEVADALSGATPRAGFRLLTRTDTVTGKKFRVLCEINQSWDWNNHWTNTMYPEDAEYKTSSQPAVVYAGEIDPTIEGIIVSLVPIGRSHHSGADGKLYNDLETLTTALKIASEITVTVSQHK